MHSGKVAVTGGAQRVRVGMRCRSVIIGDQISAFTPSRHSSLAPLAASPAARTARTARAAPGELRFPWLRAAAAAGTGGGAYAIQGS